MVLFVWTDSIEVLEGHIRIFTEKHHILKFSSVLFPWK